MELARRYPAKSFSLTKSGKQKLSFFVKNSGRDDCAIGVSVSIPFPAKHFALRGNN